VLTAAVALVLVGCANDPAREDTGPPSTTSVVRTTIPIPTTTLPDLTASSGLAASIRQFREDEAVDVIQIELVRDADDGPLQQVTAMRLHWPGLTDVDPTQRSVVVAPGQRVDVPTALGAVVCTSTTAPSASTGTVDLRLADGRFVTAPLLADAQVALDNVWNKGCTRQRLLDAVGLGYSEWQRSDPDGVPTATADLVITRRATTEPVLVTGVDGSVLLFVNPATPLPNPASTLDPDVDSAAVPIVVTGAGRCDGHALSDSKKTYIFQILVQVGDAEPVGIDLPVEQADRPLLNQVIVDTCGADHGR
jgi:hypothetical protein